MRNTLIFLLIAVASQMHCGSVAAHTSDVLQSVGDYPAKKKGIYYA